MNIKPSLLNREEEVMDKWSEHGRNEFNVLSSNPARTWPFFKVSSSGQRNPHAAIQPCVQQVHWGLEGAA